MTDTKRAEGAAVPKEVHIAAQRMAEDRQKRFETRKPNGKLPRKSRNWKINNMKACYLLGFEAGRAAGRKELVELAANEPKETKYGQTLPEPRESISIVRLRALAAAPETQEGKEKP